MLPESVTAESVIAAPLLWVPAGGRALCPDLERFGDRVAVEEACQQPGEAAGVELVCAGEYLRDGPPAKAEVVFQFVVQSVAFVDVGSGAGQLDLDDDFVLEMAEVAVAERAVTGPGRRSDLAVADGDSRLFPEFANGCLALGFAGVDAAAGQFPPLAELGSGRLVGVQ